ncbi:MAG: D-2-hydroxyacid dehydrogenase [Pirellulales bacterium]
MTARIIVLDGHTLNPGDNPWTPLQALGETVVYPRTPADEVLARSREADVLVVNKQRLPAEVLEQLPRLKLVAVSATGYDCVDVDAARRRGVTVCNVPVYGTDSVAQHVLALLLTLCHQPSRHDAAVRAGRWTESPDFCFWDSPQVELAGLTLGVIGFGRIGRRVGELGQALGMRVLACSRKRENPPPWPRFAWAELEEMLPRADVVSLHCNLNAENAGMVNAQFLSQMKPTAMLINTARGALVVESDLAEALNAGRLAAAAVDVASQEPIRPDNRLLTARNCLITPHLAWATLAARRRLLNTTAENIAAFLAGEPRNVVAG